MPTNDQIKAMIDELAATEDAIRYKLGNVKSKTGIVVQMLRELLVERTWRDMDSAPRNGTLILAFDQDQNNYISTGVVSAYWDEGDDDWSAEWVVTEIGSGDEINGANLTRWLPLPTPETGE